MSRSRSSSARLPRAEPKSLRRIMALLLHRGTEDTGDGSSQLVPPARLNLELLATLGGQVIELRAAVVLRRALIERNPTTLDQAVQRRIQRTLLHLQHMIRAVLDRFGNRMAVSRPEPECPENQQVQSALEQLNAVAVSFSRHPRCTTVRPFT